MRTYKISLLILTLPVILLSQQVNYSTSEKTTSTPFLIRANDDPAQMLRQELNQIINRSIIKNIDSENYPIDSLISESVTGSKIKFLFEYNNEDRMTERTGFWEINGEWQLLEKVEYFYDSFNNLNREIYFDWNNVSWDSSLQFLYEYNQFNFLISTTLQTYVSVSWENEVRSTYTYDQAENQITSLTELWQNNHWTNSTMVNFYYSPENRRDSLLFQEWDGNNWQNFSRSSFFYDSLTTYLNLIIAQLWTGNQFQDYLKLRIINDELGNQIQQIEEIWNGIEWVNDIKKDYTYVWNYFESCNAELWNGINWEPGDTPIIVNNPDGFNIGIVCQNINIYYIIVNVETTNTNTPNDFSLFQNYPNPFNPVTKIKYSIPTPPVSSPLVNGRTKEGFVTLKVYDLLGREIASLVNEEKSAGEYEVEFNGNNFPSGIYFYQLKAGQFSETKKMILIK